MKILIRQFLGKSHSWSVCGWGWAGALIDAGHEVHLFSTDGINHLPMPLKPYLIGYTEENSTVIVGRAPDKIYDCQISYTCIKNFPHMLSNGLKNRFGIWVYEWGNNQHLNVLPTGFAKHYQSCDMLCPPSQFGKQIFLDAGIPVHKIKVVPHGIFSERYKRDTTIVLPTNKTFKLGCPLAQNHLRKNIPGLLEAYGKAFSNQDDVCLILKAKEKPITAPFEVSLNDCLKTFNQKFPQHAEVKIFSTYIDDMSDFYRSIDAVYTMSFCEGFNFLSLEGIAAGKMSIVPNHGGHLDFLRDQDNALLISGKEERANPKSMYWGSSPNAMWFRPDIDHTVEQLRFAYQNYETFNRGVDSQRFDVYNRYDWGTITSQFLELCK